MTPPQNGQAPKLRVCGSLIQSLMGLNLSGFRSSASIRASVNAPRSSACKGKVEEHKAEDDSKIASVKHGVRIVLGRMYHPICDSHVAREDKCHRTREQPN